LALVHAQPQQYEHLYVRKSGTSYGTRCRESGMSLEKLHLGLVSPTPLYSDLQMMGDPVAEWRVLELTQGEQKQE